MAHVLALILVPCRLFEHVGQLIHIGAIAQYVPIDFLRVRLIPGGLSIGWHHDAREDHIDVLSQSLGESLVALGIQADLQAKTLGKDLLLPILLLWLWLDPS